jgi:hypothetical protein
MAAWRRFFALTIAWSVGLGVFVYAFLAIVDPFDTLPLSPRFDRPPIATNARYSFPALARSARFDAAIIGTSTSRLLRPAALNPLFGAAFANLSMNDAQAYEQYRLLQVFTRYHGDARVVMIGLDRVWCGTGDTHAKYTPRPFPEWIYEENRWRRYLEIYNLYTVEQAGQQFGVLTGLTPARYGRDGFTVFLPDDKLYDLARARAAFAHMPRPNLVPASGAADPGSLKFPTHALLSEALETLAPTTLKLLFFVPYYAGFQAEPDTPDAAVWGECKQRIAALARATPHTVLADFMIQSPITREETNYWDPLHFRVSVVERLERDLWQAAEHEPSPDQDYRLLKP